MVLIFYSFLLHSFMFCPVPSSVPLTLFPCLFTVSYFYNIDIELISWNIIYQIWYLRDKKKKWQHAEKEAKHCALCSRDSPHKQAIETAGSESGLNLMPFLRGLSVFMVSSCRSPSGKRYSHLFFNHQKNISVQATFNERFNLLDGVSVLL